MRITSLKLHSRMYHLVFFFIALVILGSGSVTYHLDNFKTFLAFSSVIVLFFLFVSLSYKTGVPVYGDKKFFGSFILFILLSLVSLLWERQVYAPEVRLSTLLVTLVFLFLITNLFDDEKKIYHLFLSLSGLVLLLAVLSFLEIRGIRLFSSSVTKPGRVQVTMGNSNYYAGLLEIFLPLSLTLFFYSLFGKEKKSFPLLIFSGISFVFGLISLTFTGTRGAFVSTFLGIFLFFLLFVLWMRKKNKESARKILFILGIVLLLIVLTGLLSPSLRERFFSGFSQMALSENPLKRFLKGRYYAYESAMQIWLSRGGVSFLLGRGMGSFPVQVYSYYDKDFFLYTEERNFSHVHNEYLELLAEGGLLSLGGWLFFLSLVIYYSLKVYSAEKSSPCARFIAMALLSSFLGILLHSVISLALRKSVVSFPFYLLAGLSYANWRNTFPGQAGKKWSPRTTYGVFILGAVLLGSAYLVDFRFFLGDFYFLRAENFRRSEDSRFPETIDKSLAFYPSLEARYAKGVFYYPREPEKALEIFLSLEKQVPGYARVNTLIGVVYTEMGQYEKAAEALTRQLTKYHMLNERAFIYLISSLVMDQHRDEAVFWLKEFFIRWNMYYRINYLNLPKMVPGELRFVQGQTRFNREEKIYEISEPFLSSFLTSLEGFREEGFDSVKDKLFLAIGRVYEDLEYSDLYLDYFMDALPSLKSDRPARVELYRKIERLYKDLSGENALARDTRLELESKYLGMMLQIFPNKELVDKFNQVNKELRKDDS